MPRRRDIRSGGGAAIPGATVHIAFTDTADGDLAVRGEPDALGRRRRAVAAGPWTWLDQVHGAEVVVVGRPGEYAGRSADASVTAMPGAVLAVHTADCAGVLLWGDGGPAGTVVGAAHAGWRGLAAGVLERTVAAMADLGATEIHWQLGPCISGPEYEFGEDELGVLVDRYGPTLRTTTTAGRAALDLRSGVRAALGGLGATEDADGPVECTATSGRHWSWRARGDTGRQAAVIWFDSERGTP